MAGQFADKLAYALKAHSLSRGRIAAALAVNKSVVSRWLSGIAEPRSHNLAQLTALIAERAPGFSMLDWDLPQEAFEQRLAPASLASGHPLLALPALAQSAVETAAGGARFVGLWRMLHPSFRVPKAFAASYVLITPADGGLGARWISDVFDWPGVAYLVAGRLNLILGLDDLCYAILAPPPAPIIESMEGLMVSLIADRDTNVGATAIYLERLTAPGIADPADPVLAGLIEDARTRPYMAATADIDPGLRARLTVEIGAAGLAEDGANILKVDAARSWSRGRHF